MSSRFKSNNIIDVYETNGVKHRGLSSDSPKIEVSEHWNQRQFINIKIGDTKHTVLASELKRAIENAQNAHFF